MNYYDKIFIIEPQPVFVKNMNITISVIKTDVTTRYVSMGRHIILNCMSWNLIVNSYGGRDRAMKWIFRDIQDHRSIPINIKNR